LAVLATDFPFETIGKADYKLLNREGLTFGNDKVITGKNFRPSYALAVAKETIVVTMPVRVVDEAVRKLANTGENKEKTDFFRHFEWFDGFTQSLKTKFNNLVRKKTFYPGSVVIQEGGNDRMAYVIVEGTCNLICTKTAPKFTRMEYDADPTTQRRDAESVYQNTHNRAGPTGRSKSKAASLQALVSNGYVSSTLKTVQVGVKSQYEWIGEDLLIAEDVDAYRFEYSAIAQTKLVTYEIQY